MKKILVSCLVCLVCTGNMPFTLAQSNAVLDQAAVLEGEFNVPGGNRKTSVAVTDENIRSVLRHLATQGGFNLMMDESVSGNVTVELDNVTINQALQAVAALGDLKIIRQSGNIFLAISRKAATDKGVSRQLSKVIKVYYSNASRIADVLNRSLFSADGAASGSQTVQKVKPDPRTNSLIVVGTAREIELAEAAVTRLDIPRQSKTFYLSHANALNVASIIAGSIFNDGTNALRPGGGGGSAGGGSSSGGAEAAATNLRVEEENIEEGKGINDFGGGSSSSGSLNSGLSSSVTLRGTVKTSSTVGISPEGPMVIPDTRQNSITIMGTAEQIALAESLIPTLDAQLPQVAIEASLIEISSDAAKDLSTRIGLADGRMQAGFNNVSVEGVQAAPGIPASMQSTGTGLIGLPTVDPGDSASFARSGISFSTNPFARNSDYLVQLRHLISNNKAKILANPTVVATHDTESIISIVNEVVRRVSVQFDPSGFTTQNVELGEAGIVMDILPKVGEDGTVSMRLRPSVTSVRQVVRDAQGNTVTLLSKRDLLTQSVRIKDGETLVIGGLIQESDTLRTDKLPMAGDLPILGAMFRASQRDGSRSELVLLITPHIMNSTKTTPANGLTSSALQTGMADSGLGGN